MRPWFDDVEYLAVQFGLQLAHQVTATDLLSCIE